MRRMPCSAAPPRRCSAGDGRPAGGTMSTPKVLVVEPIMDLGRRALEEIADVEVFESYRVIREPALLHGGPDAESSWMRGHTAVDEEVMDAAPKQKASATRALCPAVVDVEAATRGRVPVTV